MSRPSPEIDKLLDLDTYDSRQSNDTNDRTRTVTVKVRKALFGSVTRGIALVVLLLQSRKTQPLQRNKVPVQIEGRSMRFNHVQLSAIRLGLDQSSVSDAMGTAVVDPYSFHKW
ncbi:hypothetical protein NQ315_009993 [Exocentrus adspersus]|uniref:Uncharacterized protein n=1 Tax=Exocentrus adspersus TaxID=1586481 RepID=A0AAV8WIQ0_9CUCU|nr:hypothetical protein NQ315_009993 [Exocentrus adspersus]